jgi:hypothetical protein
MDTATIQSWLYALSPYFVALIPTLIGLGNRAKLQHVEIQGDGHTTALLEMVKSIDPAIAAKAAAERTSEAATAAALVAATAETKQAAQESGH